MAICRVPIGPDDKMAEVDGEFGPKIQSFMRETGSRFADEKQLRQFMTACQTPGGLQAFKQAFVSSVRIPIPRAASVRQLAAA